MLMLDKNRGNFSISMIHNHYPIHHRPMKNHLHMPDKAVTGTEFALLCLEMVTLIYTCYCILSDERNSVAVYSLSGMCSL